MELVEQIEEIQNKLDVLKNDLVKSNEPSDKDQVIEMLENMSLSKSKYYFISDEDAGGMFNVHITEGRFLIGSCLEPGWVVDCSAVEGKDGVMLVEFFKN